MFRCERFLFTLQFVVGLGSARECESSRCRRTIRCWKCPHTRWASGPSASSPASNPLQALGFGVPSRIRPVDARAQTMSFFCASH